MLTCWFFFFWFVFLAFLISFNFFLFIYSLFIFFLSASFFLFSSQQTSSIYQLLIYFSFLQFFLKKGLCQTKTFVSRTLILNFSFENLIINQSKFFFFRFNLFGDLLVIFGDIAYPFSYQVTHCFFLKLNQFFLERW